jgi:hypothetical protein
MTEDDRAWFVLDKLRLVIPAQVVVRNEAVTGWNEPPESDFEARVRMILDKMIEDRKSL